MSKRSERKAEQSKTSKDNLRKAAETWNKKKQAEKKAARRWGGKKSNDDNE